MLKSDSIADGKSIVIIHPRDNSGCSHVRLRWNAEFFNGNDYGFNCITTFMPMFDGNILPQVKAIICQRFSTEQDLAIVKSYKELQSKFGYKLVWEIDDQSFRINGKGIPDYNEASTDFNSKLDSIEKILSELLPMFDEIVVSTPFLKKCIEDIFNLHNVTVIKNVVPRYLWSFERKQKITEPIIKPKIGYVSAPQHYLNPVEKCEMFPNGREGMPGDLNNAFTPFILNAVKEDRIDFTVHSCLPYVWEEVKEKIRIIPWCDCNTYPRVVQYQHYDFTIGPLVDNDFNRCKSELRFIEACAAGSVFVGSVFPGSPYERIHPLCKCPTYATEDQLKSIFNTLCKPDVYNEIIEWQYDFMNKNQYWIESQGHINSWLSMIDGYPNQTII